MLGYGVFTENTGRDGRRSTANEYIRLVAERIGQQSTRAELKRSSARPTGTGSPLQVWTAVCVEKLILESGTHERDGRLRIRGVKTSAGQVRARREVVRTPYHHHSMFDMRVMVAADPHRWRHSERTYPVTVRDHQHPFNRICS